MRVLARMAAMLALVAVCATVGATLASPVARVHAAAATRPNQPIPRTSTCSTNGRYWSTQYISPASEKNYGGGDILWVKVGIQGQYWNGIYCGIARSFADVACDSNFADCNNVFWETYFTTTTGSKAGETSGVAQVSNSAGQNFYVVGYSGSVSNGTNYCTPNQASAGVTFGTSGPPDLYATASC